MNTGGAGIEARIARNLRRRREAQGLSLAQLAARSGVSKAMIAKVESGASSPTAGLLGRLCGGLGVTLSTLMLEAEGAGMRHFPAGEQPSWRDPATGLERAVLSPAVTPSEVEIARIRYPRATVIEYDVPPARPLKQHLVMLSGSLRFTIGAETVELRAGDCLFAIIDRSTRFESGAEPAEYLVVQEPA